MKKIFGLCEGRHAMPVEDYIFTKDIEVFNFDFLNKTVHDKLQSCTAVVLYTSGLSSALLAVTNYCLVNLIPLTVMHYNIDNREYVPQKIATDLYAPLLREGGYI